MFARLRRRFMREMPKAEEYSSKPGANIYSDGGTVLAPKTEAPLIIANQKGKPPVVIEHTQERMTPFVLNGQVWGFAYRNDPALILKTLQAPAAQVLH
jgi:hypothetical protein